jgi:ABC-type multidrug transport system ATPase subunit
LPHPPIISLHHGEDGDVPLSLFRLADALKLQDQLKSPVKTLSEGVKRKVYAGLRGRASSTPQGGTLEVMPHGLSLLLQLCFVLSILGNPSVVLLDEPSTGMDPEGQQQMW